MTPSEKDALKKQMNAYRKMFQSTEWLDKAAPAPDLAYDSRELLQRREADEPLVTPATADWLEAWFAQ